MTSAVVQSVLAACKRVDRDATLAFVWSRMAVIDGRTESNIQRLTDSDRVDEIARMLGGKVGAARKHAEELLG